MRSWGIVAALGVAALVVGWSLNGVAADDERHGRCAVIAAAADERRKAGSASQQSSGESPEQSSEQPFIAVIGDSYAQGRGLTDPARSWPARLPGEVLVDGFSGSGFSRAASPCAGVAFEARVTGALSEDPALLVVQGGLNDFDVPLPQVREGAVAVLERLAGRPAALVGPPSAPARADAVATVDALLSEVAREAGVPYVRTFEWELTYLEDRLHLTPEGHDAFGDRVAVELASLLG